MVDEADIEGSDIGKLQVEHEPGVVEGSDVVEPATSDRADEPEDREDWAGSIATPGSLPITTAWRRPLIPSPSTPIRAWNATHPADPMRPRRPNWPGLAGVGRGGAA